MIPTASSLYGRNPQSAPAGYAPQQYFTGGSFSMMAPQNYFMPNQVQGMVKQTQNRYAALSLLNDIL
jgi:hypothetical protein